MYFDADIPVLRKILVVDDDTTARLTAKAILDHHGYEVSTSDDVHAMATIERVGPQLVLLDVMMPTITGYDLLLEISKYHPDVVVIMLTGQADERSSKAYFSRNAIGVIAKPIDSKKMAEMVSLLWHLHFTSFSTKFKIFLKGCCRWMRS